MIVPVRTKNGIAQIDAERIRRLRMSYGDYEPSGTVFVDFVTSAVYSTESLVDLVNKFSSYARLAELHSPIGSSVFINVVSVGAVIAADVAHYNENAKSVIVFKPDFATPNAPSRNEQQLRETVKAAMSALNP